MARRNLKQTSGWVVIVCLLLYHALLVLCMRPSAFEILELPINQKCHVRIYLCLRADETGEVTFNTLVNERVTQQSGHFVAATIPTALKVPLLDPSFSYGKVAIARPG